MNAIRPSDINAEAAAASGQDRRGLRLVLAMGLGSVAMLLGAGGLLWWRDGERLFTEGLISAIARCF